MKQSILLVTLAALFAFGCNQSPSTSPTSINDPKHPTTANDSHSTFDIATPSFNGNTVTSGTTSGHMVCVTWQSNSPDGSQTYAQDPTSPTDLNFGHGWEYWGTSQQSMVGPGSNGHPNQPYSGHYELTMSDGTNSTEVDVTGNSYCFDNLADGTYTFTVKAKSLEGVQPNAMTHHSQTSNGYQVVVTSCYEIQLADTYTYPILGQSGGNGAWTYSTSGGATWTANSSARNQNANVIFNVGYHHFTNTQNSCTNAITTTEVGTTSSSTYSGNIYFSINGGATWRLTLAGPPHQSNSNGPTGGNGSGLGKFPNGVNTTVIYDNDANVSNGILGSFNFIVL